MSGSLLIDKGAGLSFYLVIISEACQWRWPIWRRHYLQSHNPPAASSEIVTLLELSCERRQASLAIMQFPLQKLDDVSYTPLYYGDPKINLNKAGLGKVIVLLQEQLLEMDRQTA